MSSGTETNAIYMVAYFRSYPPGDPFHWGLYVKTSDESTSPGTLFHVKQDPGWQYEQKDHFIEHSQRAVTAAKIGYVPFGTTQHELETLFRSVPIGKSENYTEEWRCNIWVRDATHLLISKGSCFHAVLSFTSSP